MQQCMTTGRSRTLPIWTPHLQLQLQVQATTLLLGGPVRGTISSQHHTCQPVPVLVLVLVVGHSSSISDWTAMAPAVKLEA